MQLLKRLKRSLFAAMRDRYFARRIRSILNYLYNTEVRQGLDAANLQRVLVLSPHPDDESIGCGGTIRALTALGVRVDVAFLTFGEKSFIHPPGSSGELVDAIRAKRGMAWRACHLLGVSELFFFGGTDGELYDEPEHAAKLVNLLERNCYQRIFCPWAHDAHSDHAATFQMLEEALAMIESSPSLWFYEVWNPLLANRIVSIDGFMNDKIHAIDIYRQEMDPLDYTVRFRGLATYRGMILRDSAYAEAFMVANKSQVLGFRWRRSSIRTALERFRSVFSLNPIRAKST